MDETSLFSIKVNRLGERKRREENPTSNLAALYSARLDGWVWKEMSAGFSLWSPGEDRRG